MTTRASHICKQPELVAEDCQRTMYDLHVCDSAHVHACILKMLSKLHGYMVDTGVGSTFMVQLPVQAGGKVEPQIMASRAHSVTFGNGVEVTSAESPVVMCNTVCQSCTLG